MRDTGMRAPAPRRAPCRPHAGDVIACFSQPEIAVESRRSRLDATLVSHEGKRVPPGFRIETPNNTHQTALRHTTHTVT
ncbi:hypothetical protein Q8A67_005501 [Cirrhinus molitorella]|uniref:Uncharacterized protein n=1 Tax=Cirrhinus molitorella TaxID=172907 RepID=A0AA88Q0G7_9TELE|nr:hypothetical protein Q8A67_005501 [Cirrhinus molitorella]